ncbi:MAG: hypothetical protein EA378_02325 [Phycisphaerales bacterium]|nr:MAG: hypothetical protein EA378_02325 [Phycisphaerales bacterium]
METPGGSIPVTRRSSKSGPALRAEREPQPASTPAPVAGDQLLLETAAAREKAEALLRGLLRARASSRRHLRTRGEPVPCPGSTGIDHAIESTRRMVAALERAGAHLRTTQHDDLLELLRDEA